MNPQLWGENPDCAVGAPTSSQLCAAENTARALLPEESLSRLEVGAPILT
jgi:hypothetical protein